MTPPNAKRSVVWSAAGLDSSGLAGLSADLRVFHSFGLHGAAICTALTAQNETEVSALFPVPTDIVMAQQRALAVGPFPLAVKLGVLPTGETVRALAEHLPPDVPLIGDPVLHSTTGACLTPTEAISEWRKALAPRLTCLTPNRPEAETLCQRAIRDGADLEKAAAQLLLLGTRQVLLKGGHTGTGLYCDDLWTDGETSAWIRSPRRAGVRFRGTGCALSSALAGAHALGLTGLDAVVMAKLYLNRSLRLAYEAGGVAIPRTAPVTSLTRVLATPPWPEGLRPEDLPDLQPELDLPSEAFPRVRQPIGFYPIVSRSAEVRQLLELGVRTLQLRIKDLHGAELEREIRQSVGHCRKTEAQLFINDYWDLALKEGAFGVHLGQEDLPNADLPALHRAGVRLGISTHCYREVATARTVKPSYLAVGPIFATTAKPMRFAPQGVDGLTLWRKVVDCPIVAIGGITVEKAETIRAAGADGISVISDIQSAPNLAVRVRDWLEAFA